MELQTFDSWSAIYEQSNGGVTRQVAAHIISLLPPLTPTSVVLDNAAGPGIVTSEILKLEPPNGVTIHAVDISAPMIAIASTLFASDRNVVCSVMPGESLDFADDTFTHSITNIGILVFTDGAKGAREIYRTLKPGDDAGSKNTAVVTSWEFLGFAAPLREACLKVRPGERPFELPIDKVWFQPGHLEKTMREAGFGDYVEMREADFAIPVASLPLLFEVFRPEMKKALAGWSEDELEEFKREFIKGAENGALTMEGANGEKLVLKMKAIIAVCSK